VNAEGPVLTDASELLEFDLPSQREIHDVAGHPVEIQVRTGRQELWIHGVRQGYSVDPGGYRLDLTAYSRPSRTLLDAAQDFLKTRPGAFSSRRIRLDEPVVAFPGNVGLAPPDRPYCRRRNFVDLSNGERHRLGVALNRLEETNIIESYAAEHDINCSTSIKGRLSSRGIGISSCDSSGSSRHLTPGPHCLTGIGRTQILGTLRSSPGSLSSADGRPPTGCSITGTSSATRPTM
jgi:hypothetical protein